MGSISPPYSVQDSAQEIFEKGILSNPLMTLTLSSLQVPLSSLSKHITFTGSPSPSIPIPWKFAESAAATKAFEASMLNLLITRKYNVPPQTVTINTDHASLYVMSPMITRILDEKTGEKLPYPLSTKEAWTIFPNQDLHNAGSDFHRALATNIYQTKDGRYYHCHGSMNPDPTLTALGLPLTGEKSDTYDSAVTRIQSAVSAHDSATLDTLMNETYHQAGTIAYSPSEFAQSEHGKANAHVGLYELHHFPSQQAPSWWPDSPSFPSSPTHPLASLKVLDLTRVIAAPSITRGLAQMGASVMRVTSPHVTDMSMLFHDLSWGKWQCRLHLKDQSDREKLKSLIREADVVVEGYRPGVMEKFGFSRNDIFDLIKDRDRGIIHVRENCYGWYGPWSHRSGWQQISDACCGVSREYAKAMGLEDPAEAVTPVFPNSDFCTGVAGTSAVLQALIQRAEVGGSFGVDVSLNYYSQWLVNSVGTYPDDVWRELWGKHGNPVFRHHHNMGYTIPRMLKLLKENCAKELFREEFFEEVRNSVLGRTFVLVGPVARWEEGGEGEKGGKGRVELGYHVGVRGNGVDEARWPEDLRVQVVR